MHPLRSDHRDDSGLALATVLVTILMLTMFTSLLLREAVTQRQQSAFQAREDVVVAGVEAMLERYAAKLTIDPLYYLHWVDEAERARRCETLASTGYGQIVQPGNTWPWPDCEEWTYLEPDRDNDGAPDEDWYVHPILDGDVADTRDDIGVLLEVYPPAGQPLEVLVVGRRGDWVHRRAISATVQATSLSEFYRVTENDLSYGSNRETFGKIYSGGDVSFGSNGKVHADVFAEDRITNPPSQWLDGAQGWQSAPTGPYNDIRDAYPQPLDFNDFWNDLDTIYNAACSGGGLCLNDADAEAWRIHAYVIGGAGKLRVCKSTSNQSESWWWTNGQSGTFGNCAVHDIPRNGAVWANTHVVIGDQSFVGGDNDDRMPGDGFSEFILKGSLTIYAGTYDQPKNVVLNADTIYDDPTTFDTLGLIASDEVIIDGGATGADKKFYINAALLGQADRWRAVGSTPSDSTLYTSGSIATRNSGSISGEFPTAVYGFDDRLEFVRPPFYPLLVNDWHYEDWTELPLPDWAKP